MGNTHFDARHIANRDSSNEVFVLTNKHINGKPSPTNNAGQNWHTDLSYTVRPAKGTCVYCMEKPSVGGDTMFANMYLAYHHLNGLVVGKGST